MGSVKLLLSLPFNRQFFFVRVKADDLLLFSRVNVAILFLALISFLIFSLVELISQEAQRLIQMKSAFEQILCDVLRLPDGAHPFRPRINHPVQLFSLRHRERERTAVVWFKLIFVLWLTQRVVAEVSPLSTTKPGCATFCGSVQIPYTFGMGSNCSMGDWFFIQCDYSLTTYMQPVPFLSKIQSKSRVRSISLDGTITIDFPLTSTCDFAVQSVDLTGSPFVFSALHNKFTGVGCNNLALMILNTSDVNLSTIAGCVSLCDNKTLYDGDYVCTGLDCCQTTIPPDLKVFDVNLKPIRRTEEREGCKYGFLVEQDWFNSTITRLSTLTIYKFVPVVLEWSIPKDMVSLLPASSNSIDCRTVKIWRTMDKTPSFRDTCHCVDGYEGNPYLSNGCHDIDECQNPALFNPNKTLVCENTNGSYKILIPEVPPTDRTRAIGIGIGIAFGVLILLFGGWGLHKEVMRRKNAKQKQKFFERNGGLLLKQQLAKGEFKVDKTKIFDSKELEKATDRFNANRILGQGGQGTVYKGMLADGKIVAVKKSTRVNNSKIEEFINEVVILSQINHRNIVKLMGCCLETEVPLLVYEFIPNGTLFNYLQHPNEDELPLTWDMRMRIATEIAGALFYLHSAASQPIYHKDIKSSNILLDEKYRAKIADFGTSRSVAIDQTHLTTKVQGTFGYLDPEFFQSSQFTEKSDVYSFGVVLVELLTGQEPISTERSMEGTNLAFCFVDSMNKNTVNDILDENVIKEGKPEDILLVANLAKRCLSVNSRARPTMKEVVVELESVQMTQKAPVDEDSREMDEFVRREEIQSWEEDNSMSTRRREEIQPWEEDNSMSTRSDLNRDTFSVLP